MFVITGGGSGIGRELAIALATRGKRVLVTGRRPKLLEETAKNSALISFVTADVATPDGQQSIINQLKEEQTIDGLIHNAGIIEPITSIKTVDQPSWEQFLATNLNAPLFLTQQLLSKLKFKKVLHIGSGAAYFPIAGWSGYCVSKAALAMLTRCWQLEEQEVAFASVMPGIIDTPMQNLIRHAEQMDQEKLNFFITLKEEKRLLNPSTVALFLSWLLLDISNEKYSSQEWDIYNTSHHAAWLKPPHTVPHWE